MKKTSLFTALISMMVFNTQAQTNVWDGSTTSTITTGGKVAIGTATPDNNFLLTLKNTNNSLSSGISLNINNNNTAAQYGAYVNCWFNNGTTGTSKKYGIFNNVVAGTTYDVYGIFNMLTTNGGVGSRYGVASTVVPTSSSIVGIRCAVYGNIIDGNLFGGIGTKPNDHRAAFFVGSTEIISSSNTEKAFIINRRDIGVAGTGTDVFRIYGDGRVFATEINVKLATSFPDYVFSPGYQLMPLREVGHFIRLNGHLPNVPTAETVEKEGMNVGEMNRVLVEKIEELTLYLLQQQAEIDSLKQEMIILKQQ